MYGGRKFHEKSYKTEVAEVLEFHQKELKIGRKERMIPTEGNLKKRAQENISQEKNPHQNK